MANRWLKRASAAAAAAGLALVFGGGTAWAANSRTVTSALSDVQWGGNGTTNGVCDQIGPSDDLNPPAGDQGWLFILTQPVDSSGSVLTYDFADPPNADITGTVNGVHMGKGKGSYHFAVYVPVGATLVSASATNGTGNLVVSHCTVGPPPGSTPPPPPPVTFDVNSDVLLADNTTVVDNAHPATAPADVHDSVTVTVTGPAKWSGVLTETLYNSGNCDSDVNIGEATVDVDQSTKSPISVLEEKNLAAGDYSYQAMFTLDEGIGDNNLPKTEDKSVCEPFKVVDGPSPSPSPSTTTTPPTTTTSTHTLPTTGAPLTGILVAAVVLIAAGGGTLFLMRRRRTAAGE
jgi:hypothetical protein